MPDPMPDLSYLLDDKTDNSPSKSPTIAAQIARALATYGSTDRWPTLSIEKKAFSICKCGEHRLNHKIGSDSSPCKETGCAQFTWNGPIFGSGKRSRT